MEQQGEPEDAQIFYRIEFQSRCQYEHIHMYVFETVNAPGNNAHEQDTGMNQKDTKPKIISKL